MRLGWVQDCQPPDAKDKSCHVVCIHGKFLMFSHLVEVQLIFSGKCYSHAACKIQKEKTTCRGLYCRRHSCIAEMHRLMRLRMR